MYSSLRGDVQCDKDDQPSSDLGPEDGPVERLAGLASKVGLAVFLLIPPTLAIYFLRSSELGLALWLGVITYLAACLGIGFYAKERRLTSSRLDLSTSALTAAKLDSEKNKAGSPFPEALGPENPPLVESPYESPANARRRQVEIPFLPIQPPIPPTPIQPVLDSDRLTSFVTPARDASARPNGTRGSRFDPTAAGIREPATLSTFKPGMGGSGAQELQLAFSARPARSYYEKFPYGLRVTIKTSRELSPVHLRVECNGPISKAEVGVTNGTKIAGLRWLITGNIYDVAFTSPSLTQDAPLIITLYFSKEARVVRVFPSDQ